MICIILSFCVIELFYGITNNAVIQECIYTIIIIVTSDDLQVYIGSV